MTEFKIPSFFILFLTFLFLWLYHSRKNQKSYLAQKEAFWNKEQEALNTRKKEIPDELIYRPDISTLSFPALDLSEALLVKYQKLIKQITASAELPMMNLRNMSNTDIRLQFGVANQAFITQAEENYDAFLNFLFDYALLMKDNHCIQEAIFALEEIIRLDSDTSKYYILLADLYAETSNQTGLQRLRHAAEKCNPIGQSKVLQHLDKLKH